MSCLALCATGNGFYYVSLFLDTSSPRLLTVGSGSIASALPWIASDFNKLSQQNWIVSAFNLTSSAFIPFWAQIADVFGRNAAITAATVLMLVGSAMCTGAPTDAYPLLLLGRALQGIAASGLNVLTRTILADGLSLQESAKNWALFALVGGLSYALGPLAGGVYFFQAFFYFFTLTNIRKAI